MTDQQPSTSADRMRKLREKRKKDDPNFSANESKRICELRKRKRESLSEMELKTLRVKERDKKRLQRAKIRNQGQSIDEPSVSTKSPYKSKQTLSKAVQKALKALPQSPSKKRAVVTELALKMNIALAESSSLDISNVDSYYEDVKAFYYRPDIVYTCPGANDFVTVWKNGIKERRQKHYLTMYLREAFCIFKEFNPNIEIGFSKFCSLRPKNVLLIKDTPSDQCKCITHENFMYKVKGLKQNYCNNWWCKILCDPSLDSKCWKNECDFCSDGKKLLLSMDLSKVCIWK